MLPQLSDFVAKFLPSPIGYSDPIQFDDGNYGFSFIREFPNGYASLVRVFIAKPDIESKKQYIPLSLAAAYGRRTANGITISSTAEEIKRTFDPIELISQEEFFYNPETDKFFEKRFWRMKEIAAAAIIEKIDRLHRKPTRPIVGLWLRIKILFWRKFAASILRGFSWLLKKILYIVTGTKLESDRWSRVFLFDRLSNQESTDTTLREGQKIEFLGYKASVWVITFYAITHFLTYTFFFLLNYYPDYLVKIYENNFLTVIYVIVTLSFFDHIFPRAMKKLVEWTDILFFAVLNKRIKI